MAHSRGDLDQAGISIKRCNRGQSIAALEGVNALLKSSHMGSRHTSESAGVLPDID